MTLLLQDTKGQLSFFYSGGKSLFARLTACTGANPEIIYQFYEFGYLDLVCSDFELTELSKFPTEIIYVLKTFKQGHIFVKFHTIHPEKDEDTGKLYPRISIIQVGYISEHFQLNIDAPKKFDPFRFSGSWINYRRASGAVAVKCQGDRIYASGLKSILRGFDYIVITKEGMKEGIYDDELLKFLFQLEPENFQGSSVVRNKFLELVKKEEEMQALLRTGKILPTSSQM